MDPAHHVDADVLDPRSRHNLHVTGPGDLQDVRIGEWSGETLFAAVKRADEADSVVVLDHGRTALYLADGADLAYDPPRVLGLTAPPALHVAGADRYDPGTDRTEPVGTVTVSPEFDVLIPAFDWEEMDEDDVLPPVDRVPSRSPTGTGTGTPG